MIKVEMLEPGFVYQETGVDDPRMIRVDDVRFIDGRNVEFTYEWVKYDRVPSLIGTSSTNRWGVGYELTGRVRGLLCTRCNTSLPLVENHLARALAYTERGD